MEYSPILHSLHVVPSPHVKNKLFVFIIMLSLWVYMIYCCVGYCSTVPNLTYASVDRHENEAEADNQESSLGASRDLLNNVNDLDSRGEEWEEIRGDAKALDDNAMSGFLNESESKKWPQAIVIGVKKGGTRALLEFLRLHPDVRAVGAEPHFFDRNYDKGLEWYRYDASSKRQRKEVKCALQGVDSPRCNTNVRVYLRDSHVFYFYYFYHTGRLRV